MTSFQLSPRRCDNLRAVLGTLIEEGKLGTRPDETIKSDPAVGAAAADEGLEGG